MRLIVSCITQLKAQEHSRTYNESKEENLVGVVERIEREARERDNRLRALRTQRPQTVGYIGGCGQEQGEIDVNSPCHLTPSLDPTQLLGLACPRQPAVWGVPLYSAHIRQYGLGFQVKVLKTF